MRDGKPTAPVRLDPVEVVDPTPVVPFGPPAPAPEPVPALVASVGAPSTTAAGELAGLLPAGGELNPLTLVLALIAVLGGGTAWKFYRQRSKEQHELALRELELRSSSQPSLDCKAEHATVREELRQLAAKIAEAHEAGGELTKRVAKLEAAGGDLELPDGIGDLDARVTKLEKAAKAAKGRAAK